MCQPRASAQARASGSPGARPLLERGYALQATQSQDTLSGKCARKSSSGKLRSVSHTTRENLLESTRLHSSFLVCGE